MGRVIGIMQRLAIPAFAVWWSTIRRSCSKLTILDIGPDRASAAVK